MPTHCEAIHNATECNDKNDGYEISCAWVNASSSSSSSVHSSEDEDDLSSPLDGGRCIVWDGNCSVLPSEASCDAVDDCKKPHRAAPLTERSGSVPALPVAATKNYSYLNADPSNAGLCACLFCLLACLLAPQKRHLSRLVERDWTRSHRS